MTLTTSWCVMNKKYEIFWVHLWVDLFVLCNKKVCVIGKTSENPNPDTNRDPNPDPNTLSAA